MSRANSLRILITGSTGSVGRELTKALSTQGLYIIMTEVCVSSKKVVFCRVDFVGEIYDQDVGCR